MVMSDSEDYPGPSHDQPEKEGQDPRGRADEEMVKPPERPLQGGKKPKKVGGLRQNKSVRR